MDITVRVFEFPDFQVRLRLQLLVAETLLQRVRARIIQWFDTHVEVFAPNFGGAALNLTNEIGAVALPAMRCRYT
jgi:hypothetical protein